MLAESGGSDDKAPRAAALPEDVKDRRHAHVWSWDRLKGEQPFHRRTMLFSLVYACLSLLHFFQRT